MPVKYQCLLILHFLKYTCLTIMNSTYFVFRRGLAMRHHYGRQIPVQWDIRWIFTCLLASQQLRVERPRELQRNIRNKFLSSLFFMLVLSRVESVRMTLVA